MRPEPKNRSQVRTNATVCQEGGLRRLSVQTGLHGRRERPRSPLISAPRNRKLREGFGFSGNTCMCRRPVAAKRPISPVAMVLRASVAAYLLLTSTQVGAAIWKHGEDRPAVPAVQTRLCRYLRQEASEPPDSHRGPRSPFVFGGPSRPFTEALRDDRPPQVRVEVRRWRTANLASGGKAPLSARLYERRSGCGASRPVDPSHSLHELFCTWVI